MSEKLLIEKKIFEANLYYEVSVCTCGGLFLNRVNDTINLSNPPSATFLCNKCGAMKTLFENDWPGFKARADIVSVSE